MIGKKESARFNIECLMSTHRVDSMNRTRKLEINKRFEDRNSFLEKINQSMLELFGQMEKMEEGIINMRILEGVVLAYREEGSK